MIHQIQKIHDHISSVYYSETLFESNALRQFLTLINWCIFSAISIIKVLKLHYMVLSRTDNYHRSRQIIYHHIMLSLFQYLIFLE